MLEYNYGGRPIDYLPECLDFKNGKAYTNQRPGLGVDRRHEAADADRRGHGAGAQERLPAAGRIADALVGMLLLLVALAVALETPPVRVAVTVEVDDRLSATARQILEAEVGALFRPLTVELDWRADTEDAPIQLTIAARPGTPVITGCSRGLHDHRLAVASLGARPGTGRVVLWVGQVRQAASGNWDRPAPPLPDELLGRALGRALAHELGHILLGQRGHDSSGLMQRSLSRRDLIGGARGFSKEQRKRLARLSR